MGRTPSWRKEAAGEHGGWHPGKLRRGQERPQQRRADARRLSAGRHAATAEGAAVPSSEMETSRARCPWWCKRPDSLVSLARCVPRVRLRATPSTADMAPVRISCTGRFSRQPWASYCVSYCASYCVSQVASWSPGRGLRPAGRLRPHTSRRCSGPRGSTPESPRPHPQARELAPAAHRAQGNTDTRRLIPEPSIG